MPRKAAAGSVAGGRRSSRRGLGGVSGAVDAGARSLAESDGTGPRPKKARSGVPTCAACGQSSANVEWQSKTVNRRTNEEEPYDDKCKLCWRKFSAGFAAYMSWDEYCAACGDLKSENDEVGRHLSSADKAYFPESVGESLQYAIRLERNYQVLNAAEFRKTMGAPPHSRMPRVPTLWLQKEVPDENEPLEQVFVFAHPALPHRTMRIETLHMCERRTNLMTAEQHAHKAQGSKTLCSCLERRSAKSAEQVLFQPGTAVAQLDQYRVPEGEWTLAPPNFLSVWCRFDKKCGVFEDIGHYRQSDHQTPDGPLRRIGREGLSRHGSPDLEAVTRWVSSCSTNATHRLTTKQRLRRRSRGFVKRSFCRQVGRQEEGVKSHCSVLALPNLPSDTVPTRSNA